MDERRTARVSEAVREELAELIGFELDDPRLADVQVTDVQVSSDGRYAHIKVAVQGVEKQQKAALAALEHASPYLRHEVGSRLSLRHVPELHFSQDRNADADSRVEILLRRAKKSRGRG
jgi:ribosome-binding factor A